MERGQVSIQSTAVDLDHLAMHAMFVDVERGYSLNDFTATLQDLDSLMTVGAIIDIQALRIDLLRKQGPSPEYSHVTETGNLPPDESTFVLDAAVDLMARQRVLRITYASPLDVWLTVVQIGGGTVLLGRGAIYLFERLQAARVSKHAADTKIEAMRLMRESLRIRMQPGADFGRPDEAEESLEPMLASAARALDALDSLDLRPGE